jgi:DNA-binding NarL/FixJ family response regulator
MNVLIVDDHPLIREGIAMMVKAIQPDAGVWVANSCASGIEVAARQAIDLTFLDLQLPDQPGFVALECFRECHALMSIVVISAQEDRATVMHALELGAKAFIPKSADSARMRCAVEALLDGQVYLPESVLGPGPRGAEHEGAEEWHLTERQQEVLALLIKGLSNKMIARKLNIVESTVKIHVSAILRELKVATRTQALVTVARHGVRLPLH